MVRAKMINGIMVAYNFKRRKSKDTCLCGHVINVHTEMIGKCNSEPCNCEKFNSGVEKKDG